MVDCAFMLGKIYWNMGLVTKNNDWKSNNIWPGILVSILGGGNTIVWCLTFCILSEWYKVKNYATEDSSAWWEENIWKFKKNRNILKNTILKGVAINSSVEAVVNSIFYWHIAHTRVMICMLIFVLLKRWQGLLPYILIMRQFVEYMQWLNGALCLVPEGAWIDC